MQVKNGRKKKKIHNLSFVLGQKIRPFPNPLKFCVGEFGGMGGGGVTITRTAVHNMFYFVQKM